MNLWIRSQDKTTLIKTYELYIAINVKNYYVIRAKRTSHILGSYKSMERALEVLDEIQTKIATYDYQHKDMKCDYIKYESCIYEMPKE